MKKAELSINMIVIVVISLVVLVILVFLVTNRSANLDRATKCTSVGGVCKPYCPPADQLGGPDLCPGSFTQYCCNPLSP